MEYFGKMKQYASKATNLADRYLNETPNKDHTDEISFLKDKLGKLETAVREMSQTETETKQ